MIRYISYILALGILVINEVNTKPNILSEKDMLYNDNKQVKFRQRLNPSSMKIGQVGGIDTDFDGNLIVFHRGSRKWTHESFENNNLNRNLGPIQEDVLASIDPDSSKQLDSWGANKFYMPHGLTIDSDENIWLTDVGLHQVFKYDFKRSNKPVLTLGVPFAHGNNKTHFCKPTSIAVSQINGDVFVADGYCNSRVVHFDKKGNYIKDFQDKDAEMIVVHSVALIEDKSLVCTVSREDGRIICFDIKSGEKVYTITDPNMKTVYAIEYDPYSEVIHAVTGPNADLDSFGLTFDARSKNFGKLLQKWQSNDEDLTDSHDIAVSPTGSRIYVGQLNGEIDTFSFH